MATVNGVGTSTSTSGSGSTSGTQSSQSAKASSDAKSASLDYTAFLNLLMAQLKNQDPTKPMDSTEYMSQLAAFSGVEQNVKMNTKLDQMLTLQSLTQAENLVGKNVANVDDTIKGKVASVSFTSNGPVATLDTGKTLDLSQIVKVAI